MAIKKRESVLDDEEGLNITPLIDCVFLLLIFFMVTTVFKNPAQLKMVLPDAENPLSLEKRQLICELDEDDNIALNGKITTIDSFDAELIDQKRITSNNTLLIKADVAAKHGTVLKIMKLARGVQIETIAMAVEPVGEE
ncbi:ExbD/TolR family protein [Candidatus Latescibacterota bacterium]